MMAVTSSQAALRGLATALFLAILLAANVAQAGSFSVSPVRANLSAQERVVALRVTNSGAEAAAIQAELMAWRQQDGEEIHEPSRDVLVTPPIFTVPAGETQIIRIGLRRPPGEDGELSYRLFLQELPAPIPEHFQGLRVAMRVSLPVFVAPASAVVTHDLAWRVRQGRDGTLLLSTLNNGNGHAQITALTVQLPDGRELHHSGNTYVLPGADREWSIPAKGAPIAAGAKLVLIVSVNGKDLTAHLRAQ